MASPDDARSSASAHLQRIADCLGCPVETFRQAPPHGDADAFELLRLWNAISDPVGRRRLLILARREAAWSGSMEPGAD